MDASQLNTIVNFIWGIADDVLRDVYVRGKYRDVILPMTVIRRLDVILEESKTQVLDSIQALENMGISEDKIIATQIEKEFGLRFYNKSKFTLRTILNEPTHFKANFEHYLRGFSENVQEIILKFKFYNQLETLQEHKAIGKLIEKFVTPNINLSPYPVEIKKEDKVLQKHPALSNLGMGYVFEELIRKFNEENNEEAGEHFTPRDIIQLIVHLAFEPIKDRITDGLYTIYDDACGSGGMLTEAENFLKQLALQNRSNIQVQLYGQEVNPETYAICTADMLIKGEDTRNIAYGSTLGNDQHGHMRFNFMFANPPYGKSWQLEKEYIYDEKKKIITDHRFKMGIPRSSDGQLLFLLNKLSKMNEEQRGIGSRIVHVHNGSALFTGDAGQGESEIRKWMIENDYLEAIIGLPLNMFYNTGIATYLWVLSNRKANHRQGKIQLIDATNIFRKLRKNQGQKNCEFSPEQIGQITKLYLDFKPTLESKIFDNQDFGYTQITVERPLRLNYQTSKERLLKLEVSKPLKKLLEQHRADLLKALASLTETLFQNETKFIQALQKAFAARNLEVKKTELKAMLDCLSEKDESADPVTILEGKERLVVPDPELRDHENVPLTESIDTYFEREVCPHVPDAWIDPSKNTVGYEINFTKHFYQYQPLRNLADIKADILKLEAETDGVLKEIIDL